LADLFLDTLPMNAHATASDALWAGLPLLTCLGNSFGGRVAGSLLRAVGLPELVTETPAQYEELALALARDPGRLAGIRAKLARNRDTEPLFDTARYTRDLAAAYAAMWRRQQAGLPPAHIDVAGLEQCAAGSATPLTG
jgi:predicted O-linked N-acetylglucosamine transferase (SPINDLY family)